MRVTVNEKKFSIFMILSKPVTHTVLVLEQLFPIFPAALHSRRAQAKLVFAHGGCEGLVVGARVHIAREASTVVR